MCCRKWQKLKDQGFGRDKIETLLLRSGFRIVYPPNYLKTTQSVRIHQFDNLIKGLEINGINKVVQTDITYFWMNGRFGYLVFIIDVYSRLIVGYHASTGLQSVANMKALEMMIKLKDVNKDLISEGYGPLKMGIGLNTGEMTIGKIGSAKRFD